ncbi:MAG: PAS/PAC sensor-containing diguanylate cyclase [Comamonadaceae bacterium]|nr:MAG: PAS/PAC sensor-containing diguanylate cyclase [Comamonadaceae bacterium]
MPGKLILLCAQSLEAEVAAMAAAEAWPDVTVAAIPDHLSDPSPSWNDLRPLLGHDCTQVLILDCACLQGLGDAPAHWPPVRHVQLPAGFDRDYLRQCLARWVAQWHLEQAQQLEKACEHKYARELADHQCAMDFLGRLTLLKDERDTITAIAELFQMLFAPQVFYYACFEGDTVQCDEALPPELSQQILALKSDWAWTASHTGFLLRIGKAHATQGVVVVDQFEFPEYRDHYLNLALSFAGVISLAIDNARTYRRIMEAEEALRKSERSLKIAQSMAHLGHWELDVGSGDIRWSDETYRILGYEPDQQPPSFDALLQVITPDDRERVAQHILSAQEGSGFDIEFRIILPDGRVRVLHGMGEVILLGNQLPQVIGAIRDITPSTRTQLLGVVQDITEQKELQWKLEREARTDPLTGCINRRHFLELAEHELARARRYGEPLSVLMLDLDHFKLINDQHGHPVGDVVLQRLVQICQASLRAEDAVGRLGGEEFAILLPESSIQEAQEAAERLCLAIAATEISLNEGSSIHFTASIGVATLAREDADIHTLIGRADKALYEAKHAGRNRVVVL